MEAKATTLNISGMWYHRLIASIINFLHRLIIRADWLSKTWHKIWFRHEKGTGLSLHRLWKRTKYKLLKDWIAPSRDPSRSVTFQSPIFRVGLSASLTHPKPPFYNLITVNATPFLNPKLFNNPCILIPILFSSPIWSIIGHNIQVPSQNISSLLEDGVATSPGPARRPSAHGQRCGKNSNPEI